MGLRASDCGKQQRVRDPASRDDHAYSLRHILPLVESELADLTSNHRIADHLSGRSGQLSEAANAWRRSTYPCAFILPALSTPPGFVARPQSERIFCWCDSYFDAARSASC